MAKLQWLTAAGCVPGSRSYEVVELDRALFYHVQLEGAALLVGQLGQTDSSVVAL